MLTMRSTPAVVWSAGGATGKQGGRNVPGLFRHGVKPADDAVMRWHNYRGAAQAGAQYCYEAQV